MEYAILVDPSIIPTAFLSTCVIFGCFSLSAMFSDQRRWLYLGGTLMSLMSMLLLMSVVNLFIGSKFLYQVFIFYVKKISLIIYQFIFRCIFIWHFSWFVALSYMIQVWSLKSVEWVTPTLLCMSLFFAMRNLSFYALILLINFFYYRHSVLLFLDFLDVFRYLIIILTQKVSFFFNNFINVLQKWINNLFTIRNRTKGKRKISYKNNKMLWHGFLCKNTKNEYNLLSKN